MSQESFLAGHYQAATVMLGVSSKAAVLHFVPRCERVLKELGIKPRKCRDDSAVELLRWIEDTVEQHRKALVEAVQRVGGENWIDDLPALLRVATGIRLTRNEAGHPTPHIVDRDECRNMIGLFPRLAEALWFRRRPSTGWLLDPLRRRHERHAKPAEGFEFSSAVVRVTYEPRPFLAYRTLA